MWEIFYSKQSQSDAKKIRNLGLKSKVEELIEVIRNDPFSYPPEFEILKGRMKGFISRKINKQHRLVYQVFEQEKRIKILKMWTHYE